MVPSRSVCTGYGYRVGYNRVGIPGEYPPSTLKSPPRPQPAKRAPEAPAGLEWVGWAGVVRPLRVTRYPGITQRSPRQVPTLRARLSPPAGGCTWDLPGLSKGRD